MQKQSLGLIAGLFGAFLASLTLGGSIGCTSILGNFEVSDGGGNDGGGGDGKADAADAPPDVPKGPFMIGGHVTALMGSGLVLHDNGGDALSVSSSGPFTFATEVANGGSYDVSVATQPTAPNQSCVVIKGKGVVDGADVANVEIVCTTDAFTVSGKVSHLAKGDSVILENNGLDDVTVDANGAFSFKVKVPDQGSYAVTVKTQPAISTDTCYIASGTGTIAEADVTNVVVSCSDCGRFSTGFTGTTWNAPATNPYSGGMFMSDYLPPSAPGTASFYVFAAGATSSESFTASTSMLASIAASPVTFVDFSTLTWFDDSLWSMQGANILSFDTGAGTWSEPFTTLTSESESQTTVDNAGNLWGYASPGVLNEYNIKTGVVTTHTLTTAVAGNEPRILYDGCADLLYLADYSSAPFYSFDPASSTQTTLSGLPGIGVNFQDGFCGDRSGHIFAYATGEPVYQYTIATDTWVAMPTGPVGGSDSACTVGADGNLYATDPDTSPSIFTIPLQ